MVSRRKFIEIAAVGGTGIALGCGLEHPTSSIAPSFAPPQFPYSGLEGNRDAFEDQMTVLEGSVPADMSGHGYIVGALPYGDGTPIFNGDGKIYRFSPQAGSLRIKTRMVETHCYLVDHAVGDDPEMKFQAQAFARTSSAFGFRNFGNTAFLNIQDDRLLVTYDGGRPWEIDPQSLEVITPIGLQSAWRPMLPALTPGMNFFTLCMSCAHPAYDPATQTTFIINYAAPMPGINVEPITRLLWWDGESEPQSCNLIDESGHHDLIDMSCHQMWVTKNHILFMNTALQVEPEQLSGMSVMRAQSPVSELYMVKKEQLLNGAEVVATKVTIPIEGLHFFAAYNDDELLTVLIAHMNSTDASEWIRHDDTVFTTQEPVDPNYLGLFTYPADRNIIGKYEIDPVRGTVVSQNQLSNDDTWGMGLTALDLSTTPENLGEGFWQSIGHNPDLITTRVAEAYRNHPHRQVPIEQLPQEPLPSKIMRINHDTLEITDQYKLPLGHLALSPTFFPKAEGEANQGYILSPTLCPTADEVWIYDSTQLSKGPICRLSHPRLNLPFTFHSTWLPTIQPSPAPYRTDNQQDYGPRLSDLTPQAQQIACSLLGIRTQT